MLRTWDLGMAEAREQRTTQERSGSGDLANANTGTSLYRVRAYLLVRAIATLSSKGYNGAMWARVLFVGPRGRRADASGRYA
jgi:hypothetical protein